MQSRIGFVAQLALVEAFWMAPFKRGLVGWVFLVSLIETSSRGQPMEAFAC